MYVPISFGHAYEQLALFGHHLPAVERDRDAVCRWRGTSVGAPWTGDGAPDPPADGGEAWLPGSVGSGIRGARRPDGRAGTGICPSGYGRGTRPGTSCIPEAIELGIDGPKGQIVVCAGGHLTPGEMLSHTSMSRSRSASRPWPSSIRRMIFSSQPDPSRQGVHCPQDSRWKKRVIRHPTRTGHVVSSIAVMAPEPAMEPASAIFSLARKTSRCCGPNQGEDAPPGIITLSTAGPALCRRRARGRK